MGLSLSNKTSEETEDFSEINIIPLVDVMLVLLIIFMVTAPLSIGGIDINLPHSKAKGAKIDEDRIVLTIDKEGQFFIDKTMVPRASLLDKMKAIYTYREKKVLYIRADREVKHGRVIEAMGAAKLAGVTKMSHLTQPPPKKRNAGH